MAAPSRRAPPTQVNTSQGHKLQVNSIAKPRMDSMKLDVNIQIQHKSYAKPCVDSICLSCVDPGSIVQHNTIHYCEHVQYKPMRSPEWIQINSIHSLTLSKWAIHVPKGEEMKVPTQLARILPGSIHPRPQDTTLPHAFQTRFDAIIECEK